MRDEVIRFQIAENSSTQLRYSTIKLIDNLGVVSETIQIMQRGGNSRDVHVQTPGTLENIMGNEDLSTIEELHIAGNLNVFDYEFLKNFSNLKTVDCSSAGIKNLNVTGCTALTKLITVYNGGLKTIEGLNTCVNLTDLYIYRCGFEELDIKANKKLQNFTCNYNKGLTRLDVSENTELSLGEQCGKLCYIHRDLRK